MSCRVALAAGATVMMSVDNDLLSLDPWRHSNHPTEHFLDSFLAIERSPARNVFFVGNVPQTRLSAFGQTSPATQCRSYTIPFHSGADEHAFAAHVRRCLFDAGQLSTYEFGN